MRKYSPVLNLGRFRFELRPVATAAMAVAVALFAALGNWQLERSAEKRMLDEDFTRMGAALPLPPASITVPRYQRVIAAGHYDTSHQFLLDNMSESGSAGVHVLTPLLLADDNAVLVDRGWAPFGVTRDSLPDVAVGSAVREVTGRMDQLPRPSIRLAAAPAEAWPRLTSFPEMHELASQLGRGLHPQLILLDPQEPDGFVRNWQVPGTTSVRHLGYAIQWFAFAVTAVAIWIALGLSRSGEPG
ncbi:MAG: SURF1 family protein [Gammaproteobacteria bacterium]|nr:SURF1 family protein [Gammaproteobacteria bacterium]